MIIKNITENNYITVTNDKGRKEQVAPGKTVIVKDVTGKGLLNNYPHIFKKIETEAERHSSLQKQVDYLKSKLIEKDKEIKALKNKLGLVDEKAKEEEETQTKQDIEIEMLQKEYMEVLGKDKVPVNKKNDVEWLRKKIEEAKK